VFVYHILVRCSFSVEEFELVLSWQAKIHTYRTLTQRDLILQQLEWKMGSLASEHRRPKFQITNQSNTFQAALECAKANKVSSAN